MTKGLSSLHSYCAGWRLAALPLFCCCLMLFLGSFAHAAPIPLMPIEEVQPGSHGVARTVISGVQIEEFGVEILGIMKNKGAVGDLILVRTYGDVIERSGGVAQGMSGSPVFIGGRLIGAIGYGWSLTDQKTAMVTPIHDMLKLFDRNPERKQVGEPLQEQVDETDKTPSSGLEMRATPLMAGGFGETALNFLRSKLKPLKLVPYSVGDSPSGIAYGDLEPGSAVGVQLVRGDVSLGALGTVTYVDGNRLLAFGHPFLRRGTANYLMTQAYIFTTIRGLESSFKLGVTGDVIGTVNQDRGAGVAGEMNRYPGIVPMLMNIRDSDERLTRNMAVQMVQDEEITPILATASLLNAIEKSIDRSGPGTARILFEISARGMPGGVYKRENMFYSPENVSEAALAEFYEFLAFLASNPHNQVNLMEIKADVSVSQERLTARILSARPLKDSALPGETIDVEVKLKPYRAEPMTRTVSFTVPKEQAPGSLGLTVRGGGFFSLSALMKKLGIETENPKPSRKPQKSFDAMLKEFSGRDRNNDIVVEPTGVGEFPEDFAEGDKKLKTKLGEKEKASAELEPVKPERTEKAKPTASLLQKKPEQKNKGLITTDYIVEGDTEISLEIVKTPRDK